MSGGYLLAPANASSKALISVWLSVFTLSVLRDFFPLRISLPFALSVSCHSSRLVFCVAGFLLSTATSEQNFKNALMVCASACSVLSSSRDSANFASEAEAMFKRDDALPVLVSADSRRLATDFFASLVKFQAPNISLISCLFICSFFRLGFLPCFGIEITLSKYRRKVKYPVKLSVNSCLFRTFVRIYSVVCVGDYPDKRQAYARNARFYGYARAHTCYIHRCYVHAYKQTKSRTHAHYIPRCYTHAPTTYLQLVCEPNPYPNFLTYIQVSFLLWGFLKPILGCGIVTFGGQGSHQEISPE